MVYGDFRGQVGVSGQQFCCGQQSWCLSDPCPFATWEDKSPWCLKHFWEMDLDLHWENLVGF